MAIRHEDCCASHHVVGGLSVFVLAAIGDGSTLARHQVIEVDRTSRCGRYAKK